jgi:NAD(P)-dependent dehydrogenase (short-subunit alcohol dehydrogenase family)
MTNPNKWFITGVSSGLGRALAQAALARGDTVVGTVRKADDLSRFEALASGRAIGRLLDVRDAKAVRRVIDEADAEVGGIDRLVNCAGYCLVGGIEEAEPDEIRAQMEVNVFGAISVLQAVLPHMRKRRAGHIFNITSISGIAAWMGIGYYCASKHALEAIGKALAQEVAGLGIYVTNVAPGAFRTGFNHSGALTRSAAQIADYDETVGFAWSTLSESSGTEAGDPARAAAAILLAADAQKPPRNLLLGADAVYYYQQQLSEQATDLGNWMPITIQVNHLDSPPHPHG